VLSAISFNDELGSERDEVDDVTANRSLPPEVEAERLKFAQRHPQFDFLRGETLTKCAGIFICQGSPRPTGQTFSYAKTFPQAGKYIFLIPPLVGARRAMLADGMRQCANISFAEAAPHPSHRSLRSRCATLPTRGRDKQSSRAHAFAEPVDRGFGAAFAVGNIERVEADFDDAEGTEDHRRIDVAHVGDAEGLALQLADPDA
jgi:hypothetical protein